MSTPRTHDRTRPIGYALALLQAASYSTMAVFTKCVYATGMTFTTLCIMRMLITVVLLGGILLVWRKHALFSRQPLVYVQGICFATSAITYFLAVKSLNANLASVLFFVYPAFTAIASALVFRERITARVAVALVFALGGVGMISGVIGQGGLTISLEGILFDVASAVLFAINIVIGQKITQAESSYTTTFTMMFLGLIIYSIIFAGDWSCVVAATPQQVGLVVGMALFNTIIPIVLLFEAIKRIGATTASLIGIAEAPFSVLIAFIVLGETFTLLQGAGMLCIVVSIFVITLPARSQDEQSKNPSEKHS